MKQSIESSAAQTKEQLIDVKKTLAMSATGRSTGPDKIRIKRKWFHLAELYAIPDPERRLARVRLTEAQRDFARVALLGWAEKDTAKKFKIKLGAVSSGKNSLSACFGVKRSTPEVSGILSLILRGVEEEFCSHKFEWYPRKRRSFR